MGVLAMSEKELEANGGVSPQPEAATATAAAAAPKRRLTKCCCGCTLLVGCVVIGTFGLVNGISTLYLALYVLSHGSLNPENSDENLTMNVLMLFYGVLHLVTGIALIYGADKRRPSLLKLWLFTRYVEFILIVGAALYLLILILANAAPAVPVMVTICSFAFGIGLLAYCIAIVHSYCQEITDNIMPLREDV